MSAPVEVGLAGAGPWARDFHAPTFAAGPETRLAGVWSRREPAARTLAERFGVPAFPSYDELLERCEAVVFAVPPDVQPGLAVRAARRGRALLLEKPIALTVADARELADAVDEAGVATQLVLTNRYRPAVREFLKQARGFPAVGAQACQLTGEFLDDTFAGSPWRSYAGVLYNTGPHGLDMLDAALGRITEVRPAGNRAGFLSLTCLHESDAVSQLAICGRVPPGRRTRYELYGPEGTLVLDSGLLPRDAVETRATLRSEFATAVRTGRSHDIDVHRGLHLQELLAQAARW
ncbi:Gfo/Idh/MocA family protein [Nonomuraea rhizosphaerae]|uniref:Gfo/Idh/MocA family protein n=1 Tax=Nonomuraea rhizosphaerae TaxID=2665663 RepID=UPI001C5D5711|nr:Gfo/Idh/MocA family oxidoreductase [Nonomuraea rhizosphaerae]